MSKISIIVPVYNVEEYLPRCIDSILAQTFTDFELILVDDGSPDNCPQICDDYAKKDSRIKVIHKENGGVSSARNMGLDVATGDYISFVDSDDVIHPRFYEIMLGNIRDADMIYCDYFKFSNEYTFENDPSFDVEIFENDNVFYKFPFSIVWNKLIKKQIVENLRFDISMKNGEDSLFAFYLFKKCKKTVYVISKLYGYFIRNDGAVGSIDVKGKRDVVRAFKQINKSLNDDSNKMLKKEFERRLNYAYINLYNEKKELARDEYLECKKHLKQNLFSILFVNSFLNTKEKVALVLNLMGIRF